MNIVIINNLYEPFERGGAERIAKLQFEGLRDEGHKVITISLCPYRASIKSQKEHYYLSSIFPGLNKMPKTLRLFWHFWDFVNFVNYFKIIKILKTNKIDTVITHNITGIGKLTLSQIPKKYKHIHVLHDIALLHPSGLMFYGKENILNSFFANIFQKINKIFTKNISLVISPSAWLLDLHLQKKIFKNAKTIFLPNPIKIKKQTSIKKKKKCFNFLYVGLINKSKGVDVLLDAFLNIDKKANLILIGQLLDQSLLRLVDKNSSIIYLGELKHSAILENMRNADCLVMPSVCYENSPTVIYEAMSQALAVISSRIGGAEELLGKFNGSLFEPGNSLSLQYALEKAIKNSTKIKKEAERNRVIIKKYNLESYTKKLENIIS